MTMGDRVHQAGFHKCDQMRAFDRRFCDHRGFETPGIQIFPLPYAFRSEVGCSFSVSYPLKMTGNYLTIITLLLDTFNFFQ